MTDTKVYDLVGNEADGKVEITLRPGFGVQVDNEHLEGGPHSIPINIALQLVTCGKAFTPAEAEAYHEGVAAAEAEAAAAEAEGK